jgi:hypothetical protein
MQLRENWSHVVGRVESWTPPSDDADQGELVVCVERVKPVAADGGKLPNMIEKAEGTTLRIRVPASAAATLDPKAGATVAVDVRRGRDPDVVFAHPEKSDVRGR